MGPKPRRARGRFAPHPRAAPGTRITSLFSAALICAQKTPQFYRKECFGWRRTPWQHPAQGTPGPTQKGEPGTGTEAGPRAAAGDRGRVSSAGSAPHPRSCRENINTAIQAAKCVRAYTFICKYIRIHVFMHL